VLVLVIKRDVTGYAQLPFATKGKGATDGKNIQKTYIYIYIYIYIYTY
jgi:hypothetical protein